MKAYCYIRARRISTLYHFSTILYNVTANSYTEDLNHTQKGCGIQHHTPFTLIST